MQASAAAHTVLLSESQLAGVETLHCLSPQAFSLLDRQRMGGVRLCSSPCPRPTVLLIVFQDEFDDLDGEEWEVMLMNAGEDSDNASDDEGGVGGAAAGANAAGEGAGADAAGGADGDAGGGAEEAALDQPGEGPDGGAPPCAAPADEGEPMDA